MTLYSLRTALDDYRITKFDVDLNVESSYLLIPEGNRYICECPAGTRPTCRHRQMLPSMIDAGICDTEWFYDFERKLVVDANSNLRPTIDPQIIEAIAHAPNPLLDDLPMIEASDESVTITTNLPPQSWRRL